MAKRVSVVTLDQVVTAVLDRARNAQQLAMAHFAQLTMDDYPDPDETESGGFVPASTISYFEDVDSLEALEGFVTEKRMAALEDGADLTKAERIRCVRAHLAEYFNEPSDLGSYQVSGIQDSEGNEAYWTEYRVGGGMSLDIYFVGMFTSIEDARAALKQHGLMAPEDYPWKPRRQPKVGHLQF
jgi:hypothetical protein